MGNVNTQRQENEIKTIMKKCNSVGWSLISTNMAVVDTKNIYLFWKRNSN